MDINKIKKVRNTLRLQFGGGISKYDKYWNIDQPYTITELNEFSIIDKKPIFQNVENPKQVETMPKVNKINITMPTIDTETLDKHQKELDKDLTTWEKIRSGRLDYKKLKEEQEKDPEEYEKQYGELNKSLNKTVSSIGTVAQGIGQAVSANQMMTDSNLTKGIDAGYDLVADGLSKLGPVGQVAGAAMKVLETIGDIGQEYLGTGTDQQSTLDKWMDSPLFSWNVGMLNGAVGKNSDSFAVNQDIISQIGGSYGGSVNSLNEAAKKADKEYGLFSWKSREKANADIASAKHTQNMMSNISDSASNQRLAVQSMGEQAGLAYSMMTNGGYNQKYTYSAKEGGLLEWHPDIELNWELPEFKKGGSIGNSDIPEIEETTQKNVIPEGALHKNKHHMEHAEGLTKKGIPVIDDDGEQQAEIEHSEIIFTLEVTKKLEEYYQIFYSEESSNKEKEQAAIDAGKLLVYQILENTDDRTNLIESCKDGGTLKLKKSTDDLIEEALEWIPQIVIIEEEIKENSKDKSKKDDLKNQMKEALKEVLIELITK